MSRSLRHPPGSVKPKVNRKKVLGASTGLDVRKDAPQPYNRVKKLRFKNLECLINHFSWRDLIVSGNNWICFYDKIWQQSG